MKSVLALVPLLVVIVVSSLGCGSSGHPFEDLTIDFVEVINEIEAAECECVEDPQACQARWVLTDDQIERGRACLEDELLDADPMPAGVEQWTDCVADLIGPVESCQQDVLSTHGNVCSAQAENAVDQCWDTLERDFDRCDEELSAADEDYLDRWLDEPWDRCFPDW